MENWRFIPGYEGFYEVSDLGNVRSIDRIVRGHKIKGRELKSRLKNGYPLVYLSKKGKVKGIMVHKLVAYSFIKNNYVSFGLCVNHINSIRNDNRLCNLELVTPAENIRHGVRAGRIKLGHGEGHIRAILKEDDVRYIRKNWVPFKTTMKDLAEKFGVSQGCINGILNYRRWKHIE